MTAPAVLGPRSEPLWFLGTLVRPKLSAEDTGGRFALWEGVLPRGAAPPLHAHPQDETFYVLEGGVVFWAVEPEATAGDAWVRTHARPCGPGDVVFAPAGTPHTFRVDSDTARLLFVSTPAGIEDYIRALAEPAAWPWLQPPADGPRVSAERRSEADRAHGVTYFGAPPTG
jgi:quercetin dioxygenase-like cupin family protein